MRYVAGARRRLYGQALHRACFLICLCEVPLAGASSPAMADYFAHYDSDADGRVSLAEYQHYLSRGFAQMDRNHDGLLDGGEWPQPGRRALSLAQHRGHLAAAFHRQDVDGDGFLSVHEFAAPPR